NSIRVHFLAKVDLKQRAASLLNSFHKKLKAADPPGETVRARLREANKMGLSTLDWGNTRNFLREFAQEGQLLFNDLFGDPQVKNKPIEDHEAVRDAMLSIFSRPHVITVVSPEPFFPWGFLFHDPTYSFRAPKGPWDLTKFWGFRHEIQVRLEQTPESTFN